MNKKVLALLLITVFFIGFGVGYGIAVKNTIEWCVHKATYFIDIDVNEDEVSKLVYEYQNFLNKRYP